MKSLFLTLFVLSAATLIAADNRPNIIVILADDLGYGDLGYTGSKEIYTPNIDRLAGNGVIFKNGYVTHPYCGPSRAGLITGRDQARFGMEINATYSPFDQHMGLPKTEKTFGKRLQSAGYHTGIIGKWHLGAAHNFHPNNRGFDYFYGFLSGGHGYFPDTINTHLPLQRPDGKLDYGANEGTQLPLLRNRNAAEFDDYLTTALSKDAARFIQNSDDQPFCLYLAYNAPHTPLQAPQKAIKKYSHIKNKKRRVYAAMIDEMDAGIGLVIDALKASNKLDNTLIFFLSDNGGAVPQAWDSYSDFADNGPFKDGKTAFYEGGTHVPFIAHWPAALKPGTYENIVSSLDIAATAVALGNGDTSGEPLDGVNLIPFLTGKDKGQPREALFWRGRGDHSWCVRTQKAKYIYQNGKSKAPELYNMSKDPYETNNVVEEYPEVRAQLADLWNKWNANNIATNQMHAYEYQALRIKMYEDLNKRLKEEAAKKTPLTID